MAATVEEIVRDQTAGKTRDGFELRRVWLVTLDDLAWGPLSAILAVINAGNGADIGDEHPARPFCWLASLTPEATNNRLIWKIIGDYNEDVDDRAQTGLGIDKQLTWGSVTYTEPVIQDVNGADVVNSAGQAFDPPLTQERRALVATITYNSETFNPAQAAQYQGAVNEAATVVGNMNVGPRMARVMEIGATREWFENFPYWKVTIKVEINPDTWDRKVLDQGIYAHPPGEPEKIQRMSTDDGEAATEPLKLDGSGYKLDPQSADPVFLTFRTYTEKDFGPLDLEV